MIKGMVSIIIPYNKDRGWLKDAVESIEKQTYKNYEIIYSKSNNGVSYNLNRGIEKSNGEFIKYLCEDDLLTPNSLYDSVSKFNDESIDFIHGKAINFTKNSETIHDPVKKTFDSYELANRNYIHGGTLMYRYDVFHKYGYFDENLWTGEELEFNLRIMSKGAKIGYVDSILYRYRIHPKQKSIGVKDHLYQEKRKVAIRSFREKYKKVDK